MAVERRRILYVQPNSEVGGSDVALLRLVKALDPDRYSPVVVLPAEGPLAPMLRNAGAEVYRLPMIQLRTLPSPVYQSRYLAHFLPTVRRLAALIVEKRAELVHTNTLYCLYGGFAAQLARCPHLWHVREIPPAIPVARPALGRMALALSRMVVCSSQACADTLFGPRARDHRIRVLAEALDLTEWSRATISRSIRQELGIAPGVPVVGFVGRLDPWKGLDVFLDAASRVTAHFPNAVFLVSGDAPAGFETYRDAMVARAAALGLGDRIRFLGWRYRLGDIPALFTDLDLFCHTSIAPEPFGLVIIEAMAMGCPVIAARAGGPMEIVQHGVSGLLTPPGDATALAAAMRDLLADPDRRARLAAAGRARVEEVYSRPAFAARLRALSEEALAGTSA